MSRPGTLLLFLLLLPLSFASATPRGCLPPHHNASFCDTRLPAAQRAVLLAQQLSVPELVGMMQADAPPIPRLGIPGYHYGYEALHGVIMECPFPDRCYTSFPASSASAASFNRSLWWAIGKAQTDEIRAMFNAQVIPLYHACPAPAAYCRAISNS